MFGVIYSKNTGRIRSHTGIGHSSAQLDTLLRLGQSEALFKFNDNQYGDIFALQTLITQQTNLTPTNDRYAIVDTSITDSVVLNSAGNVVGAIIADPLCGDAIAGYQLIADPQACKGYKWTAVTGFVDVRPVALK